MSGLFPVGSLGLGTAEGPLGIRTRLLDEFCLKQWPEVKFLTPGGNPEFSIKVAVFTFIFLLRAHLTR